MEKRGSASFMSSIFVKSKHIPSSPRKMLLIADLVRNKEVVGSLNYLRNAPQKSSRIVYKIVSGAYKQLLNANRDDTSFPTKRVYIDLIKVDKGTIRKKLSFRAKGRADTIRQRKCHLTLSLSAK